LRPQLHQALNAAPEGSKQSRWRLAAWKHDHLSHSAAVFFLLEQAGRGANQAAADSVGTSSEGAVAETVEGDFPSKAGANGRTRSSRGPAKGGLLRNTPLASTMPAPSSTSATGS